ncbi:MAG: hypothetical protein Salg2KO_18780 [Salibacteraceae bacterium]
MKYLVVLVFLLVAPVAFAGHGYNLYHSQDGVEIYGKWRYEKPFRQGNRVLCLKVVNKNNVDVMVDMDVNYYHVAVINETFSLEDLCIAAGSKVKGSKDALCFVSDAVGNGELVQEEFHWKIEDVEVDLSANCD